MSNDKTPPNALSKEQENILATTFIAMLSTIRHNDGRISTNPVTFLWNGQALKMTTLKSRMKYKNLLANPKATACIISPEDHMRYIEIRGKVHLEDDHDRSDLRENFLTLMGEEPPDDLDPPGSERATLYLTPEQVSSPVLYGGRFHKDD